eukprot:snap_masked-scaffold_3-processed-gene-2.32-mRNA-1 protein AED:1.00 eAED:1.00 QI:0/-1/0/0/-1/1/1/0/64
MAKSYGYVNKFLRQLKSKDVRSIVSDYALLSKRLYFVEESFRRMVRNLAVGMLMNYEQLCNWLI